MDRLERAQLLGALHRGTTSRNRDFERFQDPSARQVLHAHRRLRSLLREMQQPDAEVRACWSDDGCTLHFECCRPRLRYLRRLTLTEWEATILLRTAVGASLAVTSGVPT